MGCTVQSFAWVYESSQLLEIQKKIIRNVFCKKYKAHTDPLFKKLGLLKIEDLSKLNTLKFYYKLCHDKVPEYFKSYQLQTQQEIHGRETRFNFLIPEIVTRIRLSEKCLRNNLPSVLNSTPQIAICKVETHSFQGFTNYLKKILVENYSSECNTIDCYIC